MTTRQPQTQETILVVEDDDGLRELIVRTLKKAGYAIAGCSSGGEALERIAAEVPAALLIDQKLPDMTGQDMLATLVKTGITVPFIMMTGQGDERLAVEMMKLGASDYLIKDMDFLDLLPVAIRRMFNTIRTEQALRVEQMRLEAITRSARDAIVMMAPDGSIAFWNPGAERIFGWSRNAVLGQPLHTLLAPERYQAAFDEAFTRFQATGQGREVGHTLELEGRCADGREVPVELALSAMQLDDGWHAVGVMRDITERQQTEEEQARLQAQLQQSQKMESVGALAGGVAHDFNNMLGVIMGHAELGMMETDPAQPIHRRLKQIMDVARRSGDIVQQLLAFARKQIIAPRVLDVNHTVEDMLNMLRRLIGEHIHLVWRPSSHLERVKMDPSQISQLLVNLCVNARDAIGDTGSISIETRMVVLEDDERTCHTECLPGEYVLLSVTDTGCGIPPEVLPHIFDPFYTTKEVGRGTGLGLATVYGIARQNQGHVRVYSEPNQGTCFNIYLPRHSEAPSAEKPPAASGPLPEGHETILLVEDDSTLLEMGVMMLEKLGYRVISAATPPQALQLAEQHRMAIDLLITDVIMPNMNGRELAARLTAQLPHLRCLLMSGYTADIIARQGVLDEGTHFIQKPFSLGQLATKIREVLK